MMRRAADKAVFLFLPSQNLGFPKLVILRQLTGVENLTLTSSNEMIEYSHFFENSKGVEDDKIGYFDSGFICFYSF